MKKTLIVTLTACVLGLVLAGPASAANTKKGKGSKAGKAPSASASAVLAQYDTDKDGQLSDSEIATLKQEFETSKPEVLKQYDLNADGKLDDAEITALKSGLAKPAPAATEKKAKKKKK